jgi:hypothetical protein
MSIPLCILIPLHRNLQTFEEKISVAFLNALFKNEKKIFLSPVGFQADLFLSGAEFLFLNKKFFSYPHGYNRLLLRKKIYTKLRHYKYMLIYQLDCIVFKNDLERWIQADFDYIGSPWFMDENKVSTDVPFSVGNGGFSLRKISTALEILSTPIKRGSLFPVPHQYAPQPSGLKWFFWNCYRRFKQHSGQWTVEDELENFFENEDVFWSFIAPKILPDYKIAPLQEALSFGMEVNPRMCVEMNGGEVPFGCHAWWKHDREYVEVLLKSNPATAKILENIS